MKLKPRYKGLPAAIHKWLALLMAVQILFWFVSGLFFAVFPIERVRSEHAIAPPPAQIVSIGAAADGLRRLGSAGAVAEKIEIRMLLGRPVALLSRGETPPRLVDLASGTPISPLSMIDAVRIAEADHRGSLRAHSARLLTEDVTEYRGPLPAWRVDFDDGADRSLYVAAHDGRITARRSDLWRVYDALWALHIMDWRNHEDFNTPLLMIATFFGLVIVVSDIILLPTRLGFGAWRRRRRASVQDASST